MLVTEMDDRTIRDVVEVLTSGRLEHPGRTRPVRTYAAGRVEWSLAAREVYSYGRHFPLARFVPRHGRHAPLWVINGDTARASGGWGNRSRTPDHQDSIRRAIADTECASIILPFSALAGASIEIDSVRPVHVRPDTQWTETMRVELEDDVPSWRHRSDDGSRGPWRYWPATEGTGFEWTEARHRLGDALFSAVRLERLERRPRPGETVTVEPAPDDTRNQWTAAELCAHNPYAPRDGSGAFHVADDTGAACVFCKRPARRIREDRTRRGRFLSSFDYQESPALYFLAQVPRGAGATVESALDSLAPRAVHAARARGRTVLRQGDIFFVPTDLTRAELAARGATFARLTQWTRDAAPRAGEAGYRPPLNAAGRRLERAHRAKVWRAEWRAAVARATVGEIRMSHPNGIPDRGARKRWTKIRAEHAAAVDRARADLRRATLGGPRGAGYQQWNESRAAARRRAHAQTVRSARERLEQLLTRGPRDANGNTSGAHARDQYRRLYGANARAAMVRARHAAAERYRPGSVHGSESRRKRRELARTVLAIYGTAHGATETARIPGGGFYATGTVRHVPDLEPGRNGARDHAPLTLEPGRWYLALRNRVPRQ